MEGGSHFRLQAGKGSGGGGSEERRAVFIGSFSGAGAGAVSEGGRVMFQGSVFFYRKGAQNPESYSEPFKISVAISFGRSEA